jgi:hypothetical protein
MPTEIGWLVEGQIILWKGKGQVSEADLQAAAEVFTKMLDSSPHQYVHLLADDTETTHYADPRAYAQMKSATHEKIGWIVVYGQKQKLFRFFTAIIAQLTKLRIRTVQTRGEALAYLWEIDNTLPDMLAVDISGVVLNPVPLPSSSASASAEDSEVNQAQV